jgi:hypothetical protein
MGSGGVFCVYQRAFGCLALQLGGSDLERAAAAATSSMGSRFARSEVKASVVSIIVSCDTACKAEWLKGCATRTPLGL